MIGKMGWILQVWEDGCGIIMEYMVQFLGSDGNWMFINNFKIGRGEVINLLFLSEIYLLYNILYESLLVGQIYIVIC